jgi:RNA polymerase sigma-70 factor (ECF subfamily)
MFQRDPLADPAPLIRRVYGFVAYRIGAGPDAEDVTSEVFERAVRYRHTYKPSKGEPAAWLIGIAWTQVAERARRAPATAGAQTDGSSGDDFADAVVRRLTLADAVAALPDRDRELIALRYGGDLTAREIGRLLGLRANAVEVALHRALTRLRAELNDVQSPLPAALHPVRV